MLAMLALLLPFERLGERLVAEVLGNRLLVAAPPRLEEFPRSFAIHSGIIALPEGAGVGKLSAETS